MNGYEFADLCFDRRIPAYLGISAWGPIDLQVTIAKKNILLKGAKLDGESKLRSIPNPKPILRIEGEPFMAVWYNEGTYDSNTRINIQGIGGTWALVYEIAPTRYVASSKEEIAFIRDKLVPFIIDQGSRYFALAKIQLKKIFIPPFDENEQKEKAFIAKVRSNFANFLR